MINKLHIQSTVHPDNPLSLSKWLTELKVSSGYVKPLYGNQPGHFIDMNKFKLMINQS